MRILGIESSCDDTAAAVITSQRQILSSVVWSQLKEHRAYGGVVPEIAARSHVKVADEVIEEALRQADCSLDAIDLIAVTAGPGLIGGVMVGAMTAKALALAADKPLIAVNHLAGHALTVRLTEGVCYPYLLLLISGGHCQWLAVESCDRFHLLGATLDDALGEAFDKTAKMLGLGYPGGPQVEELAKLGDVGRFDLPQPLKGQKNCNFSFSGLKTAVRETITRHQGEFDEQAKADLCASFQHVVASSLEDRFRHAAAAYEACVKEPARQWVIAGGVAANKLIRLRMQEAAENKGYSLHVPPLKLCTDNAAMIAWAGYELYQQQGETALDFEPKARWPLSA